MDLQHFVKQYFCQNLPRSDKVHVTFTNPQSGFRIRSAALNNYDATLPLLAEISQAGTTG
jgi:hypothetical protein